MDSPPNLAALDLDRVTKVLGSQEAIQELTLRVPSGSLLGLVGRNGAGKTTLIRLACGLLRPTRGTVRVLGLDPLEDGLEVRRRVGVMPQNNELPLDLTAREYLDLVGRLHLLASQVMPVRIAELLDLLDLDVRPGQRIGSYSYGTCKKVALAAALLPDPPLILLDEPFEGLDPVASHTLRNLLGGMSRSGRTLVVSSHQVAVLEDCCSHWAVLDRGRLIAQGSKADLLAGTESATLEARLVELLGGTRRGQLSWW